MTGSRAVPAENGVRAVWLDKGNVLLWRSGKGATEQGSRFNYGRNRVATRKALTLNWPTTRSILNRSSA